MEINNESVELLNNKIDEAQSALSKTFGEQKSDKYNSLTYFQLEGLAKAYQKEEIFTNIATQLSSFGKEVRKMRSSFLPVDLFKNSDGILEPSLSSDLGELESYENAFMRMLGLPESQELLDAGGVGILTISKNGIIEESTFANLEEEGGILSERARRKADRKVVVNNYIYDIDKKSATSISEEPSIQEAESVQDGVEYPKLNSFESEIYKFSYLLFPPVQDSRFSRCINEPRKIVAPPFSNKRSRQINSEKIKPSLLESVIRIRVDRLSGQDVLLRLKSDEDTAPGEDIISGVSIPGIPSEEEETVDPFAENFGVLESLFILRLRASLSGLAKKFAKDRVKINEAMQRVSQKVTEQDDRDLDNGTGSTNDGASAPRAEWSTFTDDVGNNLQNRELEKLREQLLLEDAVMSLFGDNSEVLDLQLNTQRNSTIRDAHLMSGLFGIIDIPRGRIQSRIKEIDKRRENNFAAHVEPIRGDINAMIGIDIGIGNLDMIVFSLAMFTMSESGLLNLLSDSQYDRMKETTLGDAIDTIADRGPGMRIEAVNELTKLAYAGYQLFVNDLSNTTRT